MYTHTCVCLMFRENKNSSSPWFTCARHCFVLYFTCILLGWCFNILQSDVLLSLSLFRSIFFRFDLWLVRFLSSKNSSWLNPVGMKMCNKSNTETKTTKQTTTTTMKIFLRLYVCVCVCKVTFYLATTTKIEENTLNCCFDFCWMNHCKCNLKMDGWMEKKLKLNHLKSNIYEKKSLQW